MLTETSSYEKLYREFRWEIPAHFNIATACCDRHADASNRLALIYVDEDCSVQRTSFEAMRAHSSRFANVLKKDGLVRGDRIAVFLSQSLELPIAHLAAFRSGMISVPLFTLFGEDALEFRIGNSGTVYCSAQSLDTDKALTGMFDSGFAVTCRDAAITVGKLYKLRSNEEARNGVEEFRQEKAT